MWKQIQDVAYLLAWWWIKMNKIWDFDVRISKKSFTHLPNPLDLFRGCYNIAMERSTIFKNGKPSISMGHLYHGYVSHKQRVYIYIYIFIYTVWMKDIPSSRKSWLLLCVFVWSIFVSHTKIYQKYGVPYKQKYNKQNCKSCWWFGGFSYFGRCSSLDMLTIDSSGWKTVIVRNGDGSKPWYLVNPKIAGKWMFHPTKNVSIGIDPYPNCNPYPIFWMAGRVVI